MYNATQINNDTNAFQTINVIKCLNEIIPWTMDLGIFVIYGLLNVNYFGIIFTLNNMEKNH